MPTSVIGRNEGTNLVFLAIDLVYSVQVSRIDQSPRGTFILQQTYFLANLINARKVHKH